MIKATLIASCLFGATAHANSSVYTHCTGDGLTVEVGLGPGAGGTDLAQLTVDDGKGKTVAFEGIAGHGQVEKMLKVGMNFESTSEPKETGTLKLQGKSATWTSGGHAHKLSCEKP